jgi:hypothetical protein
MASGTRQTNTMEEKLRKLLPQIADMKLAEDADQEFIGGLETRLIGKLREPIDRMAAMQQTAADPMAAMQPSPEMAGVQGDTGAGGIPPQILAAMMQAQQQQQGPPTGMQQRGLSPSPNMAPGVDELRRVLQQ